MTHLTFIDRFGTVLGHLTVDEPTPELRQLVHQTEPDPDRLIGMERFFPLMVPKSLLTP